MNNRLQKIVAPGTRLFLLVLAVFAAVTFIMGNEILAVAEAGVIVLLGLYTLVDARKRRRQLVEYLEGVTYDTESAKNNTLMNFPLPIVVFKMSDYKIVWGNQIFFSLFGGAAHPSFDAVLSDMVPGFNSRWLTEGKSQYPGLVQVGERKYQLHGNIVRSRDGESDPNLANFMGITYWVDVTDYDSVKQEYENSRPVVMMLVVDNYEELMKNLPDRTRTELRSQIDDLVTEWCDGKNGLVRLYHDRYLFIFESRYLTEITEKKFDILEKVREIANPSGVRATLSIGVGRDGNGYSENFSFANLSVEMALGRGGDQAVIKNKYNFEFFGGRGTETGSRSKVKSRVTASSLAELIRTSDQVYVMGHKLADMDAVGSAVGVACICRKLEKPARIVVDAEKNVSKKLIDMLRETPEYRDIFMTPEDALVRADSRTLLVVVDTNRPEQAESLPLLESCNRVAVIDHHRRAASYIQNAALTFLEPYASSTCELMSELLQELTEPEDITRAEAEAMMAGIVLDTKNFTLRTGERTFEAAAFYERMGADTSEVKKLLQSDMRHTVERYSILQGAKLYRDGVTIAVSETEQDRVVAAQAADELLNISGIQASFVLYATKEGGVVISARSIGDLNVQLVLEKLGGGGNKSAAGAQIKDTPLREVFNMLCKCIDDYFNE